VLSTVLFSTDFASRGEQYGAIKLAGICSGLQGSAVKVRTNQAAAHLKINFRDTPFPR
jgi:hypothetical protein